MNATKILWGQVLLVTAVVLAFLAFKLVKGVIKFGVLALSFDRMRRQLRRSFRHIEGERDRLRLLLERLHEGVVTVDDQLVVQFANAEARRVLGTRLTEGDQLPEPWQTFSLREFAVSNLVLVLQPR